MPVSTVRGAHARGIVVFLRHERPGAREKIQRDDVALRVRNSFSVSSFRRHAFGLQTVIAVYFLFFFCIFYDIITIDCYSRRKTYVHDPSKPIAVPAGHDRLDKIDESNGTGSIRSTHKYRNAFASNFAQVDKERSI